MFIITWTFVATLVLYMAQSVHSTVITEKEDNIHVFIASSSLQGVGSEPVFCLYCFHLFLGLPMSLSPYGLYFTAFFTILSSLTLSVCCFHFCGRFCNLSFIEYIFNSALITLLRCSLLFFLRTSSWLTVFLII